MEKVFEIELTLQELEILQLVLTPGPSMNRLLSLYAFLKGLDQKELQKTSFELFNRIHGIIDKNTI